MMLNSILLLFFVVITGGIAGDLEMPGPKLRFKLISIEITGAPNEYMESGQVIPKEGGYLLDVNTVIIKQLPVDVMLNVTIYYDDVELPPLVLEACIAFYEQWFVRDVVERGLPKGEFPTKCPINIGNFWVRDWTYPPEKIPPGTPPGRIRVYVKLYIPNGATILEINATALLELDTSGLPKLPLGK